MRSVVRTHPRLARFTVGDRVLAQTNVGGCVSTRCDAVFDLLGVALFGAWVVRVPLPTADAIGAVRR